MRLAKKRNLAKKSSMIGRIRLYITTEKNLSRICSMPWRAMDTINVDTANHQRLKENPVTGSTTVLQNMPGVWNMA